MDCVQRADLMGRKARRKWRFGSVEKGRGVARGSRERNWRSGGECRTSGCATLQRRKRGPFCRAGVENGGMRVQSYAYGGGREIGATNKLRDRSPASSVADPSALRDSYIFQPLNSAGSDPINGSSTFDRRSAETPRADARAGDRQTHSRSAFSRGLSKYQRRREEWTKNDEEGRKVGWGGNYGATRRFRFKAS